MHKLGYTEEMLQTRSIGNVKQKQESLEKLSHTKTETNENVYYKKAINKNVFFLEKKMLDCKTKLENFRNF